MRKASDISGRFLFEERQGYPTWLMHFILIILSSSVVVTAVITIAVSHAKEGADAWIGLFITVPLEAVTFFLFRITRLEKTVTSEGIYYRWLPFQKQYRLIGKEEIQRCELRKGPASKYGSAKISGYGRVLNMSDGEGVQLYLKNGKGIFISTAEPHSFFKAIEKLIQTPNTATVYGWVR